MKLCVVLILAAIFTRNEAKPQRRFGTDPQNAVHQTAAELAKLIHMVNGFVKDGLDEKDSDELIEDERNEDSTDLKPIDLDYFMGRNDNSRLIKTVMGLLQSNYDAHKAQERPSVRDHIISNPGALEEYQSLIKSPTKPHQTSDENGETRNSFKEFLMDQRRNAVFRLDTSSMENEKRPRSNGGTIKRKPNKTPSKNYQSDYIHKKKTLDDDKNFDDRIKLGDDFDDKTRNLVDVFADVLQVKGKNKKEDDDLNQDNAWDVITKKYDWNDKDTNKHDDSTNKRQKKFKKEHQDDWDTKITKQDFDDWDNKITKKKSFDDRPKRDKKDKPKREWDSGERKTSKNKDFDNYERPKKGKKNKVSDWDTTPYTLTTFRTTKKRRKESEDKAYAPKIPSYYSKPRHKKTHNSYDNSGFFGRTPIPYVGRQGIYEEK